MNLKKRIIHESLRLFSLKGFLSTSIQDILSAAQTSKGGFYNHFKSKEDLFYQVLEEARKIWRERCLYRLDQEKDAVSKVKQLLKNFKHRYLIDSENFPGGCIFIKFAIELGDQRPHLSQEVHQGFTGLKAMIQRLLDEANDVGQFPNSISTGTVTNILFNGMLGASVSYNVNHSADDLTQSINSLIHYVDALKA